MFVSFVWNLMTDYPAGGDLPTADQMRSLLAVSEAARQARRVREASRAIITGNIAAIFCLFGTVLSLMHSEWVSPDAPFLLCGLVYSYLAILYFSIRWMKRRQARCTVTVTDRREEAARTAPARPRQAVAVVLAIILFQIVAGVGWLIAFRHMSNAAILFAFGVCPLLGVLFFTYRFASFLLWEDLLFAGCVALAFGPFLLEASDLAPLSFASLLLVAIGTASLHSRWSRWVRSVEDTGPEDATAEAQA
jgi:hypothetical protein